MNCIWCVFTFKKQHFSVIICVYAWSEKVLNFLAESEQIQVRTFLMNPRFVSKMFVRTV